MKELMMRWLQAKEEEQDANAKRQNIEIELYKMAMAKVAINKDGATKIDEDGVKLTITSKMDYKVDQLMASNHPELFKVKYEYSKTVLKTLGEDQVKTLADMIVVKPAKPGFRVEVL